MIVRTLSREKIADLINLGEDREEFEEHPQTTDSKCNDMTVTAIVRNHEINYFKERIG
jgi:hypothetical protein